VLADLLEKASAEWKHQNWTAAIACLDEYLEFEPEAAEVRTRLDDLRRQERLNRLDAYQTHAREMEKAERWDEAIAGWLEYLALQPDDLPQAEESLQAAQRNRLLAESYAQAQDALRQKDYRHAIQLLQGIITQEPSYKDTARLLAEAIVKERAAARSGNSAGSGRHSFLSFCLPSAAERFTDYAATTTPPLHLPNPPWHSFARQLSHHLPTPPLVTPTMPITITATPDWVESFVQPLVAQIEGKSPDFQDDFTEDRIWINSYGLPVEKTGAVQDGALRLSVDNGETTQLIPAWHLILSWKLRSSQVTWLIKTPPSPLTCAVVNTVGIIILRLIPQRTLLSSANQRYLPAPSWLRGHCPPRLRAAQPAFRPSSPAAAWLSCGTMSC